MAASQPSVRAVSYGGGSASGDEDNVQLNVLADAIKKMDGMIGDFRPPSSSTSDPAPPVLTSDPTLLAVVDHCEQLAKLILDLKQQELAENQPQESLSVAVPGNHPRECVPVSEQELIINWLGGINLEETQQLTHDKDELLGQVVSLQQQVEASRAECSKLVTKVGSVEKRLVEKDQQLRDVSEELRLIKVSLSRKEVELRHLQDQIQAGCRSERGGKQVTFTSQATNPHRRSFRMAFKKAFGKKDRSSASALKGNNPGLQRPVNARADAFHAKSSEELGMWFKTIGLDMYSDLVQEKMLSGEKLADTVADDSGQELVQIGILSTLHCKKLKLAVLDATSAQPSPLSEIDHEWVGQWLVDIGLPQFHRTFLDARFDGRMLDGITLEDLKLLDVTVPFHVTSIKRALQAWRMCGYDPEYLKDSCLEKNRGSQKLLHWSAKDVARWVCSIELDEYVGAMETSGIHGAVMLLDVQFSSGSLASALGISQSKTLIRKHLSKKFMELIGPVSAQNKVDAMQSKAFVPLDPMEAPSGFSRHRSRSVGRRGSDKATELLPISQFPPITAALQPGLLSISPSPDDLPTRYPTP